MKILYKIIICFFIAFTSSMKISAQVAKTGDGGSSKLNNVYCESSPASSTYGNILELEFANIREVFANVCRDYSDLTFLNGELMAGGSYSIRVKPGNCSDDIPYSNYIKVFVDWNNNGVFEDVELVSHSNGKIGTNTDFIGEFSVPADLVPGLQTRMRVVSYGVNDATTQQEDFNLVGSCSNADYLYGETIDLNITILENTAPIIFSFSPTQGPLGTEISISGERFKGYHPEGAGLSRNFIDINGWDGQGSYALSHINNALEIENIAKGEWDAVSFAFPSINVTDYPYLQVDLSASENTIIRIDLEDVNNLSTSKTPVQFEIPGDNVVRSYKFDYLNKFTNNEDITVDPSQIKGLKLFVNPESSIFPGKVTVDNLSIGSHTPQADNIIVKLGDLEADVLLCSGTSLTVRNPVMAEGEYQIVVSSNGMETVSDGYFLVTPGQLQAPYNLEAYAIAHDQIKLTWDFASDYYTHFVVSRSIDGSPSSFASVSGELQKGTFEFIDTGLEGYTTYYYKVNAYVNSSVSGDSNIEEAKTAYNGPIVSTEPEQIYDINSPVTIFLDIEASFPVDDMLYSSEIYMHAGVVYEDETEVYKGEWNYPQYDERLEYNNWPFWEKTIVPNNYFNIDPTKTVKGIKVAFRDYDGNVAAGMNGEYVLDYIFIPILRDETGPEISNLQYPTSVSYYETANVSFRVVDAQAGVASAQLRAKGSMQSSWGINEDLSISSDGIVSYNIPEYISDDFGVDFSILTTDKAGNESGRDKIYRIARKYVDQGVHVPINRAGSDVSAYEIISVPLQLDNATPEVIEWHFGEYNKQFWRLFGYSNSQGNYIEYRNGLNNFEIGKGYFFIQRDYRISGFDSGSGTTAAVTYDEPFQITLNPGWNLIGNPYLHSLSWSDIMEANNNNPEIGQLKVFDGYFNNGSMLEAFRGGFVFANSTVDLVFPLNNSNATGKTVNENEVKDLKNNFGSEEWSINFTVSSGSYKHEMAGIGMSPNASLSKDAYDDLSVPRLSQYLDVNFDHPEYFYPRFSKDVVPSSENHVWEFKIESNLQEPLTTINWENANLSNGNKKIVLLDVENQKIMDMNAQSSYTFKSGSSKSFKVYYGSKEYLDEVLKPNTYGLSASYPNPFSESTVIPFTLPESSKNCKVSIKIYNSVGQEVAVLLDKELASGFYETTWDGTNGKGGSLGSGIYICKMIVQTEAGPKNFISKIIKSH